MLRHETLTLLVTVGTLAATVWLYIIIPKGFLPLQDTGLVFAVMQGGQEVSFTEMKRLQVAVEGAIRKDPNVRAISTSVSNSFSGKTASASRASISRTASATGSRSSPSRPHSAAPSDCPTAGLHISSITTA